MSKKHISIAIILIVLIIILSELHTTRTNQQIQNDRYEAEERLKNLFKDSFSDDSTTDPKNESKQENKNDEQAHFKEEQYTLSQLEGNQQLLMLILSNIIILSHYQRFESDNAALKYISSMKLQPVTV